MPEASKAQKRVMDKLGIRHNKATSMRDASMRITARLPDDTTQIEYQNEFRDYEAKPRCTDCDKPLTPTEKLSLMPDGTTAGTYPKRPICHHCESADSGYYKTHTKHEGY
tara:strand:+ start:495 stop:824 length:330 start_codon:yes stop_codon:yes gene_type:complete